MKRKWKEMIRKRKKRKGFERKQKKKFERQMGAKKIRKYLKK